jgi:hypothetical protein
MSHITKVKTRLKDGRILRKSLTDLGYRIEESDDSPPLRTGEREFSVRKGAALIRFRPPAGDDSFFEMLVDWDRVKGRPGDVIDSIYQGYSREKVLELAKLKGYTITKNRVNEKGQIEMSLRRVA